MKPLFIVGAAAFALCVMQSKKAPAAPTPSETGELEVDIGAPTITKVSDVETQGPAAAGAEWVLGWLRGK